MEVSSVSSAPFYTPKQIKNDLKSAGTSAALSAAITLAINKDHSVKRAGKIGALAAGISIAFSLISRTAAKVKSNLIAKKELNSSLKTHQG